MWPIGRACEIIEPVYVLAAGLDALFDDSARLFRSLARSNPAARLVVAEGQDHGFLKGIGNDPVAMSELERAALWVAGLDRSGSNGVGWKP